MNRPPQSERRRRFFTFLAYLGIVCGLSFPLRAGSCGYSKSKVSQKTYALLFGTVYGPDERPVYGVKIRIRRADQKKAKWQLYSDHAGEFAVRLPAEKSDYVIWAETPKGKYRENKEVRAHFDNDERVDIALHLKE